MLNVIIALAVVVGIVVAIAISFDNEVDVVDDNGNNMSSSTDPLSNGTLILDNSTTLSISQGQIMEISDRIHLSEILSASLVSPNQYWNQPMFREMAVPALAPSIMDESFMFDDTVALDSESFTITSDADYSTTNVQVKGVDEPDYIKNDGEYAYIVTDNNLIIVDLLPASEIHVKTKVALDIDNNDIENIFLNGNDLVLFYSDQSDSLVIREYEFIPQSSYKPVTRAVVIDVSDRESPAIRADYTIDGRFNDARMVDKHVYIITTSYLDYDYPEFPIITFDDARITPKAFYFEGESHFSTFTTLSSLDLSNDYSVTSETFLMGDTGTYYVTHSNFYLTYLQSLPPGYNYEQAAHERFVKVIVPLLPSDVQNEIMDMLQTRWVEGSQKSWRSISDILQNYYNSLDADQRDELFISIENALIVYDNEIMQEQTRTVIHKVSIDESDIDYEARGSVPGRLLNQFSLGESGNGERLRVATTVEYHTEFGGFERSNSVYTLDADLDIVGKLENIAFDESIYSVRFMDDRLYMVTFQQIDPFFVIDISGDVPRILGELKIPGFSNYLHPYDDDHVIGIGRDTKLVDGRWVQPLGIKIALFNVADVSNPIVADEIIIGDDRTHSAALGDHKAFFFDKQRDIMSMPIEGSFDSIKDTLRKFEVNNIFDSGIFSEDYWTGFYIIDVKNTTGIDVRGAISHSVLSNSPHNSDTLPRTFYIDDVMYTVSNSAIIASDINSLDRLGFVKLTGTGLLIDYLD